MKGRLSQPTVDSVPPQMADFHQSDDNFVFQTKPVQEAEKHFSSIVEESN